MHPNDSTASVPFIGKATFSPVQALHNISGHIILDQTESYS